MTLLITGANGFIGSCLVRNVENNHIAYKAAVRNRVDGIKNQCVIGNVDGQTDWKSALEGVDIVIHCAARAHQKENDSAQAIKEFGITNVDGTRKLIEDCAKGNVKKIIYLSSIKVVGDYNKLTRAYNENDDMSPDDEYGLSKQAAESIVKTLCIKNGISYTIIRPPLVYGEGVKANFKALIQAAKKNLPLPLGLIESKRSLVYIENLIDFILLFLEDSSPHNQIYFVSDDHDLSVSQLYDLIKKATDSRSLSIPVPAIILKYLLILLGRKSMVTRLLYPLTIDINKAKRELNWKPPFRVDTELFKKVCK